MLAKSENVVLGFHDLPWISSTSQMAQGASFSANTLSPDFPWMKSSSMALLDKSSSVCGSVWITWFIWRKKLTKGPSAVRLNTSIYFVGSKVLNDGLFSPQWAVPTAPSILFHHQRARRWRVRVVRRKAAGPELQCGCRVSKSLVDHVLLQEYHRFWPNPTSSHWSHCNCSPQVVHDEELVLNILPTCTRTGCSLVVPHTGKLGKVLDVEATIIYLQKERSTCAFTTGGLENWNEIV